MADDHEDAAASMRLSEDTWMESWLDRWGEPIARFAYAWTSSPEKAQDVAQETFFRLLVFHREHPRQMVAPGWLFTVARNLCREEKRQQGRISPTAQVADHEAPPPALGHEERLDILKALDRLPEAYRTCLWLFYYGDLTVRDLALTLGISESAVKARLHRARHRFARIWGGRQHE